MTIMAKAPRWIERRSIEPKEHFQALDTDVDNIEAAIVIAQSSHTELSNKLDRVNARLLGLVISILAGSLTLIANLVVHH